MPKTLIEPALESGELLPLPLLVGGVRQVPFQLIHRDRDRAGPATRAMAAALMQSVSEWEQAQAE